MFAATKTKKRKENQTKVFTKMEQTLHKKKPM